ncbi:MAG TPA: hypothetical protein VK029_09905 [Pseudogracilibacillus sp.]|nr:hypothetical protein [Pseudogracilibacillus sp.]
MLEKNVHGKKVSTTDNWYDVFTGWLILPAIYTVMTLVGALIMIIFVRPSEISGFDLAFYYVDLVSIPLLLFCYYLWFRRKKLLRFFITIFFLMHLVLHVSFWIQGHGVDFISIVMNVVWIGYFLRSERVKELFVL